MYITLKKKGEENSHHNVEEQRVEKPERTEV
jgi:hypothetical protein